MKKVTKLLSVFVIAGAIGTGVAGISACNSSKPEPEHTHTAATEWQSDATNHWHKCTADDGAELDKAAHVDENKDGKCDVCKYVVGTAGFVVPEGVTGIIIEGVTERVTLSSTKTSHDIDKSAIKVYLVNKGTKVSEVPAANYELKLYLDTNTEITTWTNLKEDADYIIVATLKDATNAAGNKVTLEAEITVSISNPVTGIALKTGTVEFKQGSTASTADWTFEATRANGDKFAVEASKVSVSSIDTVTAGTQEITISYDGVTAKVNCTITVDSSLVTQSYAINANNLADEAIKANKVIDTASGVSVVATDSKAVTIEAHSKSADTKTFTKRIKLAGDANSVVIPNVNSAVAGATAETTVKTKVTIYAISGNATNKRFISFTKDDETAPNVAQAVLLDGAEITKCEFMLTEPGTYKFGTFKSDNFAGHPDAANAGSNGGINLYYIQVDKLITNAPAGVSNVPLGGEKTYVKLNVDTTNVKKAYKVGETLDTTGITASAVYANSVTAESGTDTIEASQLSFSTLDTATLGEKTVTVTYQGLTDTYKVTVETAVDGIYGATAALAAGTTTQVGSDAGKVSLKKEDVVVTLVGTNANASVSSYTVKYNNVEITTGTEFGVGTYTLVVTATVSDGTKSDTIVCEVSVLIDVKAEAGASVKFISPDTVPAETTVAEGATITENSLLKAVAVGAMEYSEGDPAKSSITKGDVSITLEDGTTKTMGSAVRTAKSSGAGVATTDITITAKSKITLTLYAVVCNDAYNSNKAGKINYSINGAAATSVDSGADRKSVNVIKVTLEANDVLTLNGTGNGEGVRLYLFGLEAKAV